MVFCIDCDEVQVFNGTIWKNLSGRAGSPPSLPFVTICNEDWTLKNLNVSTYRNGDPIPNVTNSASWAALTTGAYCYYNNDSTTYAALYGKLYNWYAVNDPRGLAPEGWHIPNVVEITTLRECLGGQSVAGAKMKEAGISHWYFPNIGATNSSGFTGLPGGYRNYDGPFLNLGQFGYGWCSNNPFPNEAPAWVLYYFDSQLITSELDKNYGYSVRLIRD
jgi:uncharacterized protein (TIGR02145 family)